MQRSDTTVTTAIRQSCQSLSRRTIPILRGGHGYCSDREQFPLLRLGHTETSESESTVRYLEDHLVQAQNLFEALPCGAALIDDHGVIGDLNQHLADIAGYPRGDLVGLDVRVLMPPRQRDAHFAQWMDCVDQWRTAEESLGEDLNILR